MIQRLLRYQNPTRWFFLHLFLGFISTISSIPFIFYFYFFLITSLPFLFIKSNLNSPLSYIIIYLSSFEILARMAKTSPLIPYEVGKYLLFILLILGLITSSRKGRIGLVLILLLIPGFFYDHSFMVDEQDLRFNLLGPVNIGLSIWYFYQQKFNEEGFKKIILVLVLPLISCLVFTILKTPDFSTIQFNLSANFDTTGGFGSNQVSTIFGLGMMLVFYMKLNNWSISDHSWIDSLLLFAFIFQGLLSFSRGGMLGGFLGIIIIIIFLNRRVSSQSRDLLLRMKKTKRYIFPIIISMLFILFLTNRFTEGNLLLRYQGETAGTLSGNRVKDFNLLTTGRTAILMGDFALFNEYGFWGSGAGASKYLRPQHRDVLSHVELGRLLAEHGYLGLLYFMILIYLLYNIYKSPVDILYKSLLFSLFFLGFFTSFHAATRTFVPSLLIGLSLIFVSKDENFIHRQ